MIMTSIVNANNAAGLTQQEGVIYFLCKGTETKP